MAQAGQIATGPQAPMQWLALHDAVTPQPGDALAPGPLAAEPLGATPMPAGTVMAEFRHHQIEGRANLIRYTARDPEAAALALTADPDGTLNLFQTAGAARRAWALRVPVAEPDEPMVVTFAWGCGAGHLTVWFPGRGLLVSGGLARGGGPLPLTRRDVERLTAGGPAVRLAPSLRLLAVADGALPPLPLMGIAPDAPVQVPGGQRPLASLRPGDSVLTSVGVAGVVWAGPVSLPARGLMQPCLLRAPYLGLREDVLVSADQRLRLRGADVEYLFDTEEVTLAARHLADERAVIRLPGGIGVDWHHLVIDGPGAVMVAGVPLDPLDGALLARVPGAPGQAALARLAVPPPPLPLPLRGFEATTLRRLRAT